MRILATLYLATLLAGAATLATASPAEAQATCRAKCTSEENACLQRTNNKGQCGGKAQVCLAKCK